MKKVEKDKKTLNQEDLVMVTAIQSSQRPGTLAVYRWVGTPEGRLGTNNTTNRIVIIPDLH